MSEVEINNVRGFLQARDEDGRVVGVNVTKDGGVALTRPIGVPGKVQMILKLTREEARTFSQGILSMIGEEDQ